MVVIIDGSLRTICHMDPLGRSASALIMNSLTNKLPGWSFCNINKLAQYDSFQCGVWIIVLVEEFLRHRQLIDNTELQVTRFSYISNINNNRTAAHVYHNNSFIANQRVAIAHNISIHSDLQPDDFEMISTNINSSDGAITALQSNYICLIYMTN